MRVQDIQSKKAKIVADMRAIHNLAEQESRDLSDDEQTTFNGLKDGLFKVEGSLERAETIAAAERSMRAEPVRRGADGTFDNMIARYGLLKRIAHELDPSVDASLEIEVSQELARRSGKNPSGFYVPHGAMLETRDVLTSGSGGNLIPDPHRADLYADVLRPKLQVAAMGATVLNDLSGNIDIPAQDAGATVGWVAEHSAVSEVTPTFRTISMDPKTVGAYVEVSRRMVINGHPGIEDILRRDLSNAIAQEIDSKALRGDGTGNTPTGIMNTSGRGTQSMSTVSWANILAFISTVEAANGMVGVDPIMSAIDGLPSTPLGWICNGDVVAVLRDTTKITNAELVMTYPNELAGFRLLTSNNMVGQTGVSPKVDGEMIFGNFQDLLVGYWSAVDILVNPYHSDVYAKGGILISALQDVDVAVRHAESFCTTSDFAMD